MDLSLGFQSCEENYLIPTLYYSPGKQEAEILKFLEWYFEKILGFICTCMVIGDLKKRSYANKKKNIIEKHGLY